MAGNTEHCPRCCLAGEELPASAFPVNRARPDGLGSTCRDCKRRYQASWYARNRARHCEAVAERRRRVRRENRRLLWDYLLGHPCACGESDPLVLQFHHEDRDKRAAVSEMLAMGYSWSAIAHELSKAVVLCANCHQRETAVDFSYWKTRAPIAQLAEQAALNR
jgi:hypothetical protein